MLPFTGKTAVVTGGLSGIGYATVTHFLQQGIKNIAILDLNDPKSVTQSLQSNYSKQNFIFVKTDVSDKDQVKKAFAQVISQFEYIDFVVACAGILREQDYELTINVNLFGVLHTTYTAMEFMSKENGGRGGTITSIASVAGLDGFATAPAYTASKHAVVGLNKSLGDEIHLTKHGIKFITICPGYTDTPLLAVRNEGVNEEMIEESDNNFSKHPLQTSDSVGQRIIETIIFGKNGAIWMIDGGQKQEIILEKHFLTD